MVKLVPTRYRWIRDHDISFAWDDARGRHGVCLILLAIFGCVSRVKDIPSACLDVGGKEINTKNARFANYILAHTRKVHRKRPGDRVTRGAFFCALSKLTGTSYVSSLSLHWRHNGRDGVSKHQPHDCLLNCLFWRRSKKTLKLRVTSRCAGNSPVTGEFPAQRASNADFFSIWWRHHVVLLHAILDYVI